MNPPRDVRWLDFAEAVALLGVSARTLERLVSDGRLTVYRLDPSNPRSKRLFRRDEVEALPQPVVRRRAQRPS